eukprot:GHVT01041579.1.p1 GENE.GHVT01041579.1~~GHVT01041579.1.p1  ORF type:complete len:235 (+),score=26.59 GHVT01041579.1:72-776(+)
MGVAAHKHQCSHLPVAGLATKSFPEVDKKAWNQDVFMSLSGFSRDSPNCFRVGAKRAPGPHTAARRESRGLPPFLFSPGKNPRFSVECASRCLANVFPEAAPQFTAGPRMNQNYRCYGGHVFLYLFISLLHSCFPHCQLAAPPLRWTSRQLLHLAECVWGGPSSATCLGSGSKPSAGCDATDIEREPERLVRRAKMISRRPILRLLAICRHRPRHTRGPPRSHQSFRGRATGRH